MFKKIKRFSNLIKFPKKKNTTLLIQKSKFNFISPILQTKKIINRKIEIKENFFVKIESKEDLENYLKTESIDFFINFLKEPNNRSQLNVYTILNNFFQDIFQKIDNIKEDELLNINAIKNFNENQLLNLIELIIFLMNDSTEEKKILELKDLELVLTILEKKLTKMENFQKILKIINLVNLSDLHNSECFNNLISKSEEILKNYNKEKMIKLLDFKNVYTIFNFLNLIKKIKTLSIKNKLLDDLIYILDENLDMEKIHHTMVKKILSKIFIIVKDQKDHKFSLEKSNFFCNLLIKSKFLLNNLENNETQYFLKILNHFEIFPFSVDYINFSLEDLMFKNFKIRDLKIHSHNLELFKIYAQSNHFSNKKLWVNIIFSSFAEYLKTSKNIINLNSIPSLFDITLRHCNENLFFYFSNLIFYFLNNNFMSFHIVNKNNLLEINNILTEKLNDNVCYLSNYFSIMKADVFILNEVDFKNFLKGLNIYYFQYFELILSNLKSYNDLNNFLKNHLVFLRFINFNTFDNLNQRLFKGIYSFLVKKNYDKNYSEIIINISKLVIFYQKNNLSLDNSDQICEFLKFYMESQIKNPEISDSLKMEYFYLISQLFENNYDNVLNLKKDFEIFSKNKLQNYEKMIETVETKEKFLITYNFGKKNFINYEKMILTASFFTILPNLMGKENFIKNFEKKTNLFGEELFQTINILLYYPRAKKAVLSMLENLLTLFTTKIHNFKDKSFKKQKFDIYVLKNNKWNLLIRKLRKANFFVEDRNSKIALCVISGIFLKNEKKMDFDLVYDLFKIIGSDNLEYLNTFYENLNENFKNEKFTNFTCDIENIIYLPLKFIFDKKEILDKIFQYTPDFKNSENLDFIIEFFFYLKKNNLFVENFMTKFLENLEVIEKSGRFNFRKILENLFEFELNLNKCPQIINLFIKFQDKISDEIKLKFIYNYNLQNSIENKTLNDFYNTLEKISKEIVLEKDFFEILSYNPKTKTVINRSFPENFDISEEKIHFNKTLINSSPNTILKDKPDFSLNIFDFIKPDQKKFKENLIRNFYWKKYNILFYEKKKLPSDLNMIENQILKNYSKNIFVNKYLSNYYHIFHIKEIEKFFFISFASKFLVISNFKDFIYRIDENGFFEENGNSLVHFKNLIEEENFEFWKFDNLEKEIQNKLDTFKDTLEKGNFNNNNVQDHEKDVKDDANDFKEDVESVKKGEEVIE